MTFMRRVLRVRIVKIALAGIIIVSGIGLANYLYKEYYDESYISPEKGVAKIKELEAVNIDSIKDKIENNSNDIDEEKSNKKEDLDFNKVFEDSVIMGDSRSEGLTEYGILDTSSVVAYKGRTVIKAKDDVYTTKGLAPSNIFMTYGMNDLEMFSNAKDFINKYKELIKEVQSEVPGANIYVTSIIPTEQKAMDRQPKFKNVYSFNKAIEDMCNELNVKFIDVNDSINKGSNLYETDGIHFKLDFYKGYLNILKEKANL